MQEWTVCTAGYLIKRILTVFQSGSSLIVCGGLSIPQEYPILGKLLASSSTLAELGM